MKILQNCLMAIRKTIQDGNISVQDFSTIKVHTSICNDCIVKDFGIIKLLNTWILKKEKVILVSEMSFFSLSVWALPVPETII